MEVNDTTAIIDGLSLPLRALHGTAVILTGVLGVVGNLLVIVSIATTPKLRTSHNAYVVNLSLADLILSAVCHPLYAVAVLSGGWPLGTAVCRLGTALSYSLSLVSIVTLTAVATNRYLLIAKPVATYHRFCGRRQSAFVLLAIWLLCAVLWVISEYAVQVDIKYQPAFSNCAANVWDPATRHFITVMDCLIVGTVLLMLMVQYIRIFLVVRASRRRAGPPVVLQLAPADQRQPSGLCCHPRPPQPAGVTKDETTLIKTFVLLTLVFVISYLPISVVFIFGVCNPVLFRAGRFSMFILSLGPVINPIIYAWMNRNVRRACYRLIRCQRLLPRPLAV